MDDPAGARFLQRAFQQVRTNAGLAFLLGYVEVLEIEVVCLIRKDRQVARRRRGRSSHAAGDKPDDLAVAFDGFGDQEVGTEFGVESLNRHRAKTPGDVLSRPLLIQTGYGIEVFIVGEADDEGHRVTTPFPWERVTHVVTRSLRLLEDPVVPDAPPPDGRLASYGDDLKGGTAVRS